MRRPFGRRRSPAIAGVGSGWVAAAYGSRADELVDALPALMTRATAEARLPRTHPSGRLQSETPATAKLADALMELRSLMLAATVTGDDVARDLRLRAAMADAVGAARGLALASSSQPTAWDLGHTRVGVNAVLLAAGRRGLAPDDLSPKHA